MIVRAPMPRSCNFPPGRKYKSRGDLILDCVLDRQADLRERDDEITMVVVMLRAIAVRRDERMMCRKTGDAIHLAMAKRIEKRVKQLLSVDWEINRAKELIDGYERIPRVEGRRADLQGVGDLPA